MHLPLFAYTLKKKKVSSKKQLWASQADTRSKTYPPKLKKKVITEIKRWYTYSRNIVGGCDISMTLVDRWIYKDGKLGQENNTGMVITRGNRITKSKACEWVYIMAFKWRNALCPCRRACFIWCKPLVTILYFLLLNFAIIFTFLKCQNLYLFHNLRHTGFLTAASKYYI